MGCCTAAMARTKQRTEEFWPGGRFLAARVERKKPHTGGIDGTKINLIRTRQHCWQGGGFRSANSGDRSHASCNPNNPQGEDHE